MEYIISEIIGFIDYFGRLRPFTLFTTLFPDQPEFLTYHFEYVSMYDLLVAFSVVSLILDFVIDRPVHSDEVNRYDD